MTKIISIDAETDGLWGDPFAVAAIVYELAPAKKLELWAYHPGDSNPRPFFAGIVDHDYKPQPHEMVRICNPERWAETGRFFARRPDYVVENVWVRDNVLPTLVNSPVTHENYGDMLSAFAEFYYANKQDADIVAHCGSPVESHLFRQMRRMELIGEWDAPFPIHEVGTLLLAFGENPKSVDSYAQKHNLEIADYGSTHNPLYDCEVAAKVFLHLMKK